jgi:tRNA-specific 2-thiouridylase
MKNWEDDDDGEYCSSRQDFLDAASVADVPASRSSTSTSRPSTRTGVFAEFLREYQAGRTPNPDVLQRRSSSRPSWTTPCAWAPTRSPPALRRVREVNGRFQLLKGLDR